MTIQHVLMRAMITTAGLTRGWQISNFTLGQWVRAVPLCIPMYEAGRISWYSLRDIRPPTRTAQGPCLAEAG